MKRILYLFVALLGLSVLAACEEISDEVNEYADWQARNETYFRDTLAFATRQVAAAQAQYGADWQQHCDWRVFPSYQVTPEGKKTWKDSIAVHVIERGAGTTSPLYTDSARVTYAGRLIPTVSYTSDKPGTPYYQYPGLVFDHTGVSTKINEIMDPRFEVSTTFIVSGLVEGFTTALLHMHSGDYWRVFIPSNMGYGTSGSKSIPGHSTLIFDMRLKSYSRAKH